jgi:AraC-like DNA-binding protein
MESEEIMLQAEHLHQLHKKADVYLHKLDAQRLVSWLAFGIIVLLLVVFVLFYLYHLRKIKFQQERVVSTLWNMERSVDDVQAVLADKTEKESPVAEQTQPAATDSDDSSESTDDSPFISRFREVVEKRLGDSDLSVDDLAADMNLSRVQLYRKVKSITGSSPVELLRSARLKKAYQLLYTSDKSVSEVAYEVGFTAPSYFTKCFREEYGMVPGDVKKN